MLNLHSAGKDPYLSASPLKPKTFSEHLQLAVIILMDIVIVIILTIVEVIKLPFYVLFKNGPKIIKGQNALVTGGANGIGKAIALELAKCGCNIIIADIDEKASEKTLELLEKYDVKSIAYSADVSNPEDIKNLKQAIDGSLGSVDILVNNAGLMPLMSLREGSCFDVERIVDVNFTGNIKTIRTFLPEMINKKKGHIVQISSMEALHPLPCAAIYTATKFAVTGMMLALEEELRQEGLADYVDFTTVHPYFVCTRRDLMNTLNLRFPAITAQRTAEETVKGIISRKRNVVIPSANNILTKILKCVPYSMQSLIRDYILREPQSRVIKNPYLYVA